MSSYYLFSNDIYDNIKMVYRKEQMEVFFKLWKEERSALYIASIMKLSEIEVFLLIADLQITGKLPERDTDYYGRELKNECN